jgi:hypothetical protein
MKKCILHIHLMELPSLGCRNGKFQMYGIHVLCWSEGLIIGNSMHLLKAFGNYPGFVYANLSICCALSPVDPSAPDKFPSRRKGNQIPSLVLKEGVVILLHGGFPKGISSILNIRLYGWNRLSGSEGKRRLLKIRLSPPSISWINNKIPCILKSSLGPLGPLLWLCICI